MICERFGVFDMEIKRFVGGELANNAYIVYDGMGSECVIIDPGFSPEIFLKFIEENDLQLKYILLTHHHYDHTGGVQRIKERTGCMLAIHEFDAQPYGRPIDLMLRDGETVAFGALSLKIINTPGHTRGSICLATPDGQTIFTGDTLFDVEIGRTDLDGGSSKAMELTMKGIVDSWQDSVKIYPGHTEPCDMAFVRKHNGEFLYAVNLPNKIKMLALDLDGTTLNSQGKLSPGNAEAISLALGQGIHTVIATGRCFCALPAEIANFSGLRYALTSNGANVIDLKTGESIYKNLIFEKAIDFAIPLLQAQGFDIEVFVGGHAYMEKSAYEKTVAHNLYGRGKYVKNTREPIENIYQFMKGNRTNIENINVLFENPSDKEMMRCELMKIPHATITSSLPYNLEIGGETAGKADAIRHLCAVLGVPLESVMACGDSPNDISMLKIVGLPLAVSNASDEVKFHAMQTVPANNDDGVAHAIRKFALN